MAAEKLKFSKPSDRITTAVSAVLGIGVLGAGLSLLFNPIDIGIAAAITAAGFIKDSIPGYRRWKTNRHIKTGEWQPVSAEAPISRMVADLSKQMGRQKAPEIYLLSNEAYARKMLPFWKRKMTKPQVVEEMMSKMFKAIPGTNTIITTQQALDRGLTEGEMRFLAAHEMSHLQTKDNLSPATVVPKIGARVFNALSLTGMAVDVAAIFGITLPFLTGAAAPILLVSAVMSGTAAISKVFTNIGMRAIEKRADRNALALTRDLESAKTALASLDSRSYNRRVKALTKAFNKMSKPASPQAPANPAAPVQFRRHGL
jgi:Zn-dependent protease with chaperone function